jgi:hypothetical protein
VSQELQSFHVNKHTLALAFHVEMEEIMRFYCCRRHWREGCRILSGRHALVEEGGMAWSCVDSGGRCGLLCQKAISLTDPQIRDDFISPGKRAGLPGSKLR